MKELIEEACQLIKDKPEECKVINWVLEWDDEMKIALKMAWRIIYDEK